MTVSSKIVPSLGVTAAEGRLIFAVAADGVKECKLLLFQCGQTEAIEVVPMCRYGESSVFTLELKRKKEYYAYLYEADGVTFVDPYAQALTGREQFGNWSGKTLALLPNERPFVCKSVEDGVKSFADLIFYKLHVRGFTMHESSGVKKKGTFAGLREKIPYLKKLGINALLLMPVYEFGECEEKTSGMEILQMADYIKKYGPEFAKTQQVLEQREQKNQQSKVNYWGYAKHNFYFAPKAAFASDAGKVREEFAACVEALHKAGIAVFLEFIFTSETKQALMIDCLRFWVREYGVDGFRINSELAPMSILLEDPFLSSTRFIVTSCQDNTLKAGPYGARVAEYNDGFQNSMRRYIKGDECMVGEFFQYMTRSGETVAKINYVADHNGFSLYDVYAYDRKHNEENGENNRDGAEYNYSWNCGEEGETKKKKILQLRSTMRNNMLAAVLLAQGTPLLMAGDELCHTKQGNNNSYCQDNEISWLNWKMTAEKKKQLAFVKELIAFRKEHKVLHNNRTLSGMDYLSVGMPDKSYHGVQQWNPDYAPYSRAAGILLSGAYVRTHKRKPDSDMYLIANMHWESLEFGLPILKHGAVWKQVFSTEAVVAEQTKKNMYLLRGRSMALFMKQTAPDTEQETK